MYKLFFMALLSLAIFGRSIYANPFEADEDDEDIIKHFEALLKGPKSNSEPKSPPKPSDEQSPEPAFPPQKEPDIPYPEENDDYVPQTPQGQPAEPLSSACQCKKYFECNVGGDKGSGSGNKENFPMDLPVVDVRWGDTIPSPCDHYLDICCDVDSVRNNTAEIRNPEYQHSICGKRNLNGVGFRVKGAVNQEAQFGEFPWMAAIVNVERQDKKPALNVFICGASLIHPGVALTAAHCVDKRNAEDLLVRLGEWDTQTSDEIYAHTDHSVVKIIIHEDFYPGALYNDVALLFLAEETKFAPHVDTVCLPPANINFDGQKCFASGWGRDSFGKEGKYQAILKRLELPIVSRSTCEYGLRRTRLGRYFRLHESFVCAGGEKGKDTCRGDGGSPLVCNVPGSESYVQYGIVAWGIGCGEEGVPGVYVNVPKFVAWITRKMSQAKLNTNYFKLGRKLF